MPAQSPPPAAKPGRRSLLGDLGVIWTRRKTLWKLLGRPERFRLLGAVFVTGLVAWIQVRIAILIGTFFNDVLKRSGDAGALSEYVTTALLILLGYYLVKESLQLLRRWLVARTSSRIESQMTVRLVSHLLRIDLGALASDRIGAMHGRISRAVEGYQKFVRVAFADFIPALTLAIAALYAGVAKDWRIGLVMIGMVPISVLLTIWQVSSQQGVRIALLQAKEGLDGTVVEQLGGLEYIRAANTHPLEVSRVTVAADARANREFKHQFAMARFDWLKALSEAIFYTAVLGYSVVLAVHKQIEYGDILTFSGLFLTIMGPMKDVHRILDESYDSAMQVNVLLQMLDQPQDQSFNVVTLRPPRLDGSIPLLECQDLVVEYKTAHGQRRILDGVTLAIHQGQTIGIAGRSGSGKSTWLRAVLRLLHPTSGEVLVGGVPIGVLSREDIGKSIGYVSQVPFVFSGTVRENIGYGCGAVGLEQIQEAARQAHIHEEIMQMPQGYDSRLTERGGNLSGGQRQRLALARMFLKNPPVLILDEGTSALDNISERQVRAAIDHARHSHTVIMVAHRLTTLNETDCIFVFDAGRVVEQGAFDDLVAKNGTFAELVRSAEAT
jgi:ATP-binding cassette, subfamily B, bacterial